MEFLSEKALRHTNTTYFVLPVLGIEPYKLEKEGCIDAYLFLVKDGIINTDINNFYILLSKEPTETFLNHHRFVSVFPIKSARTYIAENGRYEPNQVDGKYVVVMRLEEEEREELILPLLQGRFSRISPRIRERVFPLDPSHPYYIHRLIIERSPQIKHLLENDLSEKICSECELWTGFIKEKETLEVESL